MVDHAKELIKNIRSKKLRICVVGLGYVGFPLALEFARKSVSVTGIEIDKDRLNSITQRKSYISDITDEQLKSVLVSGYFRASGSFEAVREADVIFICVPTPLKGKNLPDISFIKSAVGSVALHIKKGALVILESTTYPGTTEEEIKPIFTSRGLKHGKDFYLAFSPERIDPGNKKYPVHKIPKVVGGLDPEATKLTALVYSLIIKKIVPVSSARTAEAVKLLENTFRLINIGLIDEMAMMAHKMKIDIWEVVQAASSKPFGFMPFFPGPGVGGHCIPKDPLYLHWKAKSFGFYSRFIQLASDVISRMPEYVVQRLKEALAASGKKLSGSNILVVGVTYKKDVKDLRKSPGIDVITSLRKHGARVFYSDPLIHFLKIKDINLKSVPLKEGNIKKFDCLLIATDHSSLDYGYLLRHAKLIFDARNVYKGKNKEKVIRL
jgi:UDP-N-acetyl-D-glucosamine dehydrogenase